MQNIEQLRAMIKSIPATREGNEKLAMMANDPDPMKRMLAGIEANERARTRAQKQAEQGQQQQGRRPVVQEKMDELMQAGIGGLEMNEDMYSQGMAAGGIVAFDQGGGVNTEDPLMQFSGLDAEGMSADQARFEALIEQRRLKEARDRFNFLKNAAPDTAAAMLKNNPALAERPPVAANPPAPAANPAKPNAAKPNAPAANPNAPAANTNQPPAQKDPFTLMQEYLKGDAAERAAARKDALTQFGLETGLEMMAGDSPYAFQNIGRAGAKGARSYQERLGALRTEERNVGKSLADLELKRYELNQAKDLGELQRKTQKEVAGIYASARGSDDKTRAGIIKNATAAVDKQLLTDRTYSKLKTPEEKAQYRKKLITQEVGNYGLDMAGGAGKTWEGWSGGPQG